MTLYVTSFRLGYFTIWRLATIIFYLAANIRSFHTKDPSVRNVIRIDILDTCANELYGNSSPISLLMSHIWRKYVLLFHLYHIDIDFRKISIFNFRDCQCERRLKMHIFNYKSNIPMHTETGSHFKNKSQKNISPLALGRCCTLSNV